MMRGSEGFLKKLAEIPLFKKSLLRVNTFAIRLPVKPSNKSYNDDPH
jgi:hypothetical protein